MNQRIGSPRGFSTNILRQIYPVEVEKGLQTMRAEEFREREIHCTVNGAMLINTINNPAQITGEKKLTNLLDTKI